MGFFLDLKNINKFFYEEDYLNQITFYSETANDWQHLSGIINELIFGNYLENIWKVIGKYLENNLENNWKIFRKYLENIWD